MSEKRWTDDGRPIPFPTGNVVAIDHTTDLALDELVGQHVTIIGGFEDGIGGVVIAHEPTEARPDRYRVLIDGQPGRTIGRLHALRLDADDDFYRSPTQSASAWGRRLGTRAAAIWHAAGGALIDPVALLAVVDVPVSLDTWRAAGFPEADIEALPERVLTHGRAVIGDRFETAFEEAVVATLRGLATAALARGVR